MKKAKIFFDDIALKNNFTMVKALAQEMFANHLMVQEFTKRNPENDIVINIFHVGIVKTGIMREANFFLRMLMNVFGKSPEQGSYNAVYLASDEKVNYSGYFLPKPGKTEVKEKINYDDQMAKHLWELSEEFLK